jgi:hypothetical protein
MTRDDIIRMAKECGNWSGQTVEMNDVGLERFAKLVAAAERNKVAQWMIDRGYATGHGDTVDDLLKELEWQVKEQERSACAKVCEEEIQRVKPILSLQRTL